MKPNQMLWALLLLSGVAQAVKADYFTNTSSLTTPRWYHTATILANGKVLVIGGRDTNGVYLSSTELYDPTAGSWTNTGALNIGRGFHAATLLPSGMVLVAGGAGDSGYLSSAELFNPATGTWTNTGALNTARWEHTATLLLDGKVLVAGGYNNISNILSSAELYDPATGIWARTASLTTARDYHTATLLTNGYVLVAAGSGDNGVTTSAELFNPGTGTWTATGSLRNARYQHTATLLTNGKVLVAGNDIVNGKITELYDPTSGTWTNTGVLNTARYSPTATLLPNGKVLVAGSDVFGFQQSLSSAELYDPIVGTWTYTSAMNTGRAYHSAILLNNGKVLIAGGFNYPNIISGAELYYSTNGTVLPSITIQPQPLTVTNGYPASFAVTAFGFPSLAYQWFFNGANLPGATNTMLTIQNAFPANAGAYTVVVTNNYGSVTSNPAMLTVLPLSIFSPTLLTSGQFRFNFDTATGVNYTVQYSTNLTQWFPWVTLGGIGGPLSLIDPNTAGSQQRFYRIVLSSQ